MRDITILSTKYLKQNYYKNHLVQNDIISYKISITLIQIHFCVKGEKGKKFEYVTT